MDVAPLQTWSVFQLSNDPLLHHTIPKLVGRLGIAPSSRRVRAGTSLAKFATLLKEANAKAELNRRGEVCEASLTPGFRVAENGQSGG